MPVGKRAELQVHQVARDPRSRMCAEALLLHMLRATTTPVQLAHNRMARTYMQGGGASIRWSIWHGSLGRQVARVAFVEGRLGLAPVHTCARSNTRNSSPISHWLGGLVNASVPAVVVFQKLGFDCTAAQWRRI